MGRTVRKPETAHSLGLTSASSPGESIECSPAGKRQCCQKVAKKVSNSTVVSS